MSTSYGLMRLVANNFHENAFLAATVELTIEDPLPGAKVEHAIGNSDDELSTHHLSLHVSVRIVLARPIVVVVVHGSMWG